MPDIFEIRRENLRKLAKDYGGRVKLSEASGIYYSQLNNLIGKTPTRNIGEKMARKIEDKLTLIDGYLDQDHTKGVVIPTMSPDGEIVYPNKDELFFIPVVELKLIDLISQDDSFTSKKETKMITINEIKYFDIDPKKSIYTWTYSDVMYPVVKNGDMILIDLRESPIKHREKYLIKLRGEILPARIFDLGNNKLRISFDNKNMSAEYPDEEIDMKDIKIYGKIAQIITK
jgi:Peptidase S24-like